MSKKEQPTKRFRNNTISIAYKILGIFGIPAIGGFVIGRFADSQFNIAPYGSLGAFAVAFVLSWVMVFRVYQKTMQDFKEEISNSDKKD